MEVVLLEDVKALGKKGQIVKVSDGYGRNFILTKKLGIEATPKNLNDLKLQKANEAKIAAEHLAAAKDLAKHREDKTFGTHEVPIKLHKEVTGKLAVKVVEA